MSWSVARRATPSEERRVQEMGGAFEGEFGVRPGAALNTRVGDLWNENTGEPVPAHVHYALREEWRGRLREEFGLDADGVAYGAFGYESRAG